MRAELVVQVGNNVGKRHELPEGRPVKIGRVGTNDIVILDTQLSRQHSQVVNQGGAVLITDLGSRNGTRVNGKRIVQPTRLRNGDTIEVGGTKFVLEVGKKSDEDELSAIEAGYNTMLQKLDRESPEAWEKMARWCDERNLVDKAVQCRRKAEEARVFNRLSQRREKLAEFQAKLEELGFAMCPECRGAGHIAGESDHEICLGTGIDLREVAVPEPSEEQQAQIDAQPEEVQETVARLARLGQVGHFVGPRIVMRYPQEERKIVLKLDYLKEVWSQMSARILERKRVPVTEETVEELLRLLSRHEVADWQRMSNAIRKLKKLSAEMIQGIEPKDLAVIQENAILWAIVQSLTEPVPPEAPGTLTDLSEATEEI